MVCPFHLLAGREFQFVGDVSGLLKLDDSLDQGLVGCGRLRSTDSDVKGLRQAVGPGHALVDFEGVAAGSRLEKEQQSFCRTPLMSEIGRGSDQFAKATQA